MLHLITQKEVLLSVKQVILANGVTQQEKSGIRTPGARSSTGVPNERYEVFFSAKYIKGKTMFV